MDVEGTVFIVEMSAVRMMPRTDDGLLLGVNLQIFRPFDEQQPAWHHLHHTRREHSIQSGGARGGAGAVELLIAGLVQQIGKRAGSGFRSGKRRDCRRRARCALGGADAARRGVHRFRDEHRDHVIHLARAYIAREIDQTRIRRPDRAWRGFDGLCPPAAVALVTYLSSMDGGGGAFCSFFGMMPAFAPTQTQPQTHRNIRIAFIDFLPSRRRRQPPPETSTPAALSEFFH